MQNRTDLAVESYESSDKTVIDGVIVKEDGDMTSVNIINENGAAVLGKPIGNYLTLKVKSFINDIDIFDGRLNDFATALRSVLPREMSSVLVAPATLSTN